MSSQEISQKKEKNVTDQPDCPKKLRNTGIIVGLVVKSGLGLPQLVRVWSWWLTHEIRITPRRTNEEAKRGGQTPTRGYHDNGD